MTPEQYRKATPIINALTEVNNAISEVGKKTVGVSEIRFRFEGFDGPAIFSRHFFRVREDEERFSEIAKESYDALVNLLVLMREELTDELGKI